MNLDKVFENNKNWISGKLSKDPDYFEKLGKGQNPELLYIGCSDSRVTAEELMVQQYGEDILKHRVNFDFNQSMIKPQFTSILLAHAAYLKDHSDKLITVEGYADEKGTPEYNIALGERRAIAVATYLENMGVGSNQISTTSYGEEKPLSTEHNEAAWLENRRVELVF